MTAVRKAYLASVVCSAAALSAACLLQGAWPAAIGPAVLGAAWAAAGSRLPTRLAGIPFALLTLSAAAGILAGMSAPLCLAAVLAALAAWDLARFLSWRGAAPDNAASRAVEKGHLIRLAWLVGIGGVLGMSGLFLRLQLGFPTLLALAVLLAAAFGAYLRASERAGKDSDSERVPD